MIAYNKKDEYDAFGPWIQVIGKQHALPPLFASHCPEPDRARILIKIPREIERRNAHPDMHLYDKVVGVMEDYVLILTRHGNDVTKETVAVSDIQAIQKTNDLLSGKLRLFTTQNTLTIDYNTVSDDVISRIIAIIRDMWPHKEMSLSQPAVPYDIHTIDFLYVNLIGEMQRNNPKIRLLAFQPKIALNIHRWRFITRLRWNRALQCAAFLTDGFELIMIHRSTSLRSVHRPEYAYTYTYVPLSRIVDARIVSHPEITMLKQFECCTTDHTFVTAFGDENLGIEELCRTLTDLSLKSVNS